jgi:cob(I)alamin adenosyltransferase
MAVHKLFLLLSFSPACVLLDLARMFSRRYHERRSVDVSEWSSVKSNSKNPSGL